MIIITRYGALHCNIVWVKTLSSLRQNSKLPQTRKAFCVPHFDTNRQLRCLQKTHLSLLFVVTIRLVNRKYEAASVSDFSRHWAYLRIHLDSPDQKFRVHTEPSGVVCSSLGDNLAGRLCCWFRHFRIDEFQGYSRSCC